MQKIVQAVLLTTFMAGPFCQKIVIDSCTLISPCTTGALSAVDEYLITGTIGDNMTRAMEQRWQPYVETSVFRSRTDIQIVCMFFTDIVRTCRPIPNTKCECFYNTTTDQVQFRISDTVQAVDSKAIVYSRWQNNNGTYIYANKNYTLPEIYDVNSAHLSLTVAGVTLNLSTSGSCSLTLNTSNDLKLCCFNTATPCYPQIAFNGAVVANNIEMCVTYPASQLASGGVTGNLNLSYSTCTKTGYMHRSSCLVLLKPDETTVTTESYSSSSPTTGTTIQNATTESYNSSSNTTAASPQPSDDKKCNIICIAVIVLVILAIIIAVGIAVYYYLAKKRSKVVATEGADENAEEAHTSEDEQDSEDSEETN